MTDLCEVVIVGTGFGGSVSACRLARRWPGKVAVLERGKRYGLGEFPRAPSDFRRNFWMLPERARHHPGHICKAARKHGGELHGMYDVRTYRHMDVVICAGVGGGSLIYANVFLVPPDEVFADGRWPESCKKDKLLPYYAVAKSVLGSRTIPPPDGDARRAIPKTALFQKIAREAHRESALVDISVFFGANPSGPAIAIGQQQPNRFGALQTSCTYCGECICGCNYRAKNTTDLNYLFVAENTHGAKVHTECLAEAVVPLGAGGREDPHADGAHGYAVRYRDLRGGGLQTLLARRVVVSAGCLGSTELLLRCKHRLGTLPKISDRLGQQFSGNGDFLSFVVEGFEGRPNYGPTITQRTDHHLYRDFEREKAFILEDASYPAFLAWFVEGARPRSMWIKPILDLVRRVLHNLIDGRSTGTIGFAFADLLGSSTSEQSAVLLCMGMDRSSGVMSLDTAGHLQIDWPLSENRPLYDAIVAAGAEFKHLAGARLFAPLPTWDWPIRNNITVHPLGGCVLGSSREAGVTDAAKERFGQVFGYDGLYVADGAIVPTSTGSNPVATIAALSEMVAEGITGFAPDDELS